MLYILIYYFFILFIYYYLIFINIIYITYYYYYLFIVIVINILLFIIYMWWWIHHPVCIFSTIHGRRTSLPHTYNDFYFTKETPLPFAPGNLQIHEPKTICLSLDRGLGRQLCGDANKSCLPVLRIEHNKCRKPNCSAENFAKC